MRCALHQTAITQAVFSLLWKQVFLCCQGWPRTHKEHSYYVGFSPVCNPLVSQYLRLQVSTTRSDLTLLLKLICSWGDGNSLSVLHLFSSSLYPPGYSLWHSYQLHAVSHHPQSCSLMMSSCLNVCLSWCIFTIQMLVSWTLYWKMWTTDGGASLHINADLTSDFITKNTLFKRKESSLFLGLILFLVIK